MPIPNSARDDLGLIEGSYLSFQRAKNGVHLIKSPVTIGGLRKMNQRILAREKTSLDAYRSGDGFRDHVKRMIEGFYS